MSNNTGDDTSKDVTYDVTYDVIVIGGGIAGLTAALLLKRQNLNVLLLEAQSQPGGNIKTIVDNNVHMETGPHSFMGSSEYTWKLVKELDFEQAIEPAAPTSKNRYIFRYNKLQPLPMSFGSFVGTSLLSPLSKLRLMMEPFIPNGAKDNDTAWDFFCRRFGTEAATYIMTPFISGVYAGDVKMLGARAAFNKFWKFEKESGSMIWGSVKYLLKKRKRLRREGVKIKRGLFSFNGGLGKITEKLATELSQNIQTNVSVTAIHRHPNGFSVQANNQANNQPNNQPSNQGVGQSWQARSVIVATPPPVTGSILEILQPNLSTAFYKIPMAPVALIHWSVKDSENSYPDGFGFLMPRKYDLRVLGTLFPNKLFNQRIPQGRQLFATFYGGMTDPKAMALGDEELTALLLEEHRRIFNRDLEDAQVLKIIRYPSAIPQLLPNHPESIQRIHDDLSRENPGLFLAGNYLTGVGIEHAVESGFTASQKCARFLVTPSLSTHPSQNPLQGAN